MHCYTIGQANIEEFMGLEIKLPDMPDAARDEVKWTYHGLVDRA